MDVLIPVATTIAGFIGGALLPFLMRWKQAEVEALKQIIADLRFRITALENKIDNLTGQHLECVKIQAELQGKLSTLEHLAVPIIQKLPEVVKGT